MTIISEQLIPENFFSAEKLTLVGTLVAVIWAIMTHRLVPGQFYNDLKGENERLRQALEQWRETGKAIAGTAPEPAGQQLPVNTEPANETRDHKSEPNDASTQ